MDVFIEANEAADCHVLFQKRKRLKNEGIGKKNLKRKPKEVKSLQNTQG